MKIGELVKTRAGEVIVLDIQEKYLILFNIAGGKFIKANGYQKNLLGQVFWDGGEYYSDFMDLVKVLNK